MNNWELESRCAETGQDLYEFIGPDIPTIKAHNHTYYAGEFYALKDKILWVIGERMVEQTPVNVQVTPSEIQDCSDPELSEWLKPGVGVPWNW